MECPFRFDSNHDYQQDGDDHENHTDNFNSKRFHSELKLISNRYRFQLRYQSATNPVLIQSILAKIRAHFTKLKLFIELHRIAITFNRITH